MDETIQRKLAAILSADVAGYSRLMESDEAGTFNALVELRRVVDSVIDQRNGRIANTAGDSILAEFPSVAEAIQCGVEIQQALTVWNADQSLERKMALRVGVHVGDVMVKDNDIFGDGVNVAARLQALAAPGSIVASRAVRDHLRDKSPLFFDDMGEHAVKNITRPVRVFEVCFDRPVDQQRDSSVIAGAHHERPGPTAEADQTELLFWDSVKESKKTDDYEAYLERYPDGNFAPLARTRAEHLNNGPTLATADEVKLELSYWDSVKDSEDPSLVKAYLEKYPSGHFKKLAEAMLAALGDVEGADASTNAEPRPTSS